MTQSPRHDADDDTFPLVAGEDLARTIAENVVSALFMMDERGHATYVNHAWVQMTGYHLDEMEDTPVHDVVHHTRPDGTPFPMHECPIDRALPEHRWIEPYEDVFIRKDGTFFPVRAAASPIMRGGRPVGTVVEVHDIGEEEERERRLRDAETRVRFLADASAALARSFDTDETLGEVTRLAVPTLADQAVFDLLRGDGSLERVAAAHAGDPHLLTTARPALRPAGNDRDPTRRALDEGAPVLVEDVDDDWIAAVADSDDHAADMRAQDITSMIAVPVLVRGDPVGVLTLATTGARRFGPGDVETADELARRAAVAIDNARLFHRSEFQRSLLEAQGEASVDGILVVDADGMVRSYNRRFVEIWGIAPDVLERGDEAAIAVAVEQLEDPDAFLARVHELYQRREHSREVLRVRDGRTIERHGAPVVDPDGTYHGYLWSFRDISERDAAAEALAVSEERFRSLVNATTSVVWTTDASGAFVERSPSWEAFTGQSAEEYVGPGRGGFGAIHPDDREVVAGAWADAVATGRDDLTLHYRLRRHDGVYRRVVARAVPLRRSEGSVRDWVGSITDVEDELAAREELDRQFEITKAITENATSALVMLDTSGVATYVNDAWITMTGFEAADVAGTSTHDLVHHARPDGTPYPAEECPLVRALPEGRRIDPYDDTLIRKDGTFFPARIAASPILVDGRLAGTVLEVQDTTEARRAHEALERRQRTLLRLHDVAMAFSRATSEREIADALVDEGVAAVGADRGAVLIARDDGVRLDVVATRGLDPELLERFREVPTEQASGAPEAFRTDTAIVIERPDDVAARYPELADGYRAIGFGSGAWIPLSTEHGPLGIVHVQFEEARTFAPDDVVVLRTLARQAAHALERVALLERETAARERAELIAEVMLELERVRGVRPLADRLLELIVPRLADYASLEAPADPDPVLAIRHADPDALDNFRELRSRLRLPPDDPRSVAQVADGGVQLLEEISDDVLQSFARDDGTLRALRALGARSHVSVPIWLGASRGALVLGIADPTRRPYDHGDVELLLELASRVGVRFENARLQEEEHRIALRLQRALLPDDVVRHPAIAISAHYEAGSEVLEVGGDWYDSFHLPGDRVGLVVGDVVGHGVEAAAAMGRIRSALAALAPRAIEPSEVLADLDRFAAGPSGVEFATVLYAVLDPVTREIRYASAGHPPVLVVAPDGATRWLDDGRSVPIFAGADRTRSQGSAILEPGATVVLYSDGLIERRGEPLTVGLERLGATAREVRDLPVGDAGARIVEELTADRTHDDDVVVLCVRVLGTPADDLRIVVPARPRELRAIRDASRRWLAEHDVGDATVDEVLLVVGEASSNAIEHAYRDGDRGEVEVDLRIGGQGIEIRVRDGGTWRSPPADPTRGRGTDIMEAVAASFRRTTDASGTVVAAVVPWSGDEGAG